MTKEEAIRYCDEYLARHISDIDKEFLKIAKEALQQEPCDKCVYSTSEGCQYDDITEAIPPFDDCISRKAAIDACLSGWNKDYKEIVEEIRTLPPVTPQPKTGWIFVRENLPKPFSYVNCTCRSLIDDREDWVVETCYIPQPKNSPYSDWGNIPMLNNGDCEVIAWMYREIPKPYKAEGSEKK